MSENNDMLIRIKSDGVIVVEEIVKGIVSHKPISPDSLIACIDKSRIQKGISSGLLPKNCLYFSLRVDGTRCVTMLYSEDKADISYAGTKYNNFPLPRLVFSFNIGAEGKVSNCRLGVVGQGNPRPDTPMYYYPFSNVSPHDDRICLGNNPVPTIEKLHTVGSLPHFILGLENNNDYFNSSRNKGGLEMRSLLEVLKDKSQSYYYEHILMPTGKTLEDFI